MHRIIVFVSLVVFAALIEGRSTGGRHPGAANHILTHSGRGGHCQTQLKSACPLSRYSTMSTIMAIRSTDDLKELLRTESNFENICQETRSLIQCVGEAFNNASSTTCPDQTLHDLRMNASNTILDTFCTTEVIQKARTHIDCYMNQANMISVENCTKLNPGLSCKHLDNSRDRSARHRCYNERDRRNCNVAEVKACMRTVIETNCDEGATDLLDLMADPVFSIVKAGLRECQTTRV